MKFIVKDLMVTVFPSKGAHFPNTDDDDCAPVTDHCRGCSESGSKGMIELYTPLINPVSPERLANLKDQLREVLAMVEAREKVVLDSLRPKTAAEIELLQTHFTAALEELKRAAHAMKPGTTSH